MLFQLRHGRLPGLLSIAFLALHFSGLDAATAAASSIKNEVAVKYKSERTKEFRLADYQDELLDCSALAAMHMWIGDNIGQDAGSEVRRVLGEDYWLSISKEYMSLARQAAGKSNLSSAFRTHIRRLTDEWRRLTETQVSANEWSGWYDLVDRCETWRPEKPKRSFNVNGRKSIAAGNEGPKVAGQ